MYNKIAKMSKDIRVRKLFNIIDLYLIDNFSDKFTDGWHLGRSFKCDTKWEKMVDNFVTFKIYEPKECNECIPIERRNNVSVKFTIHSGERYILDSKKYYDTIDITELLGNFSNAMINKEIIIDRYEKYIKE